MHTIGPHVSIAKGLEQAPLRAKDLRANAFGMFTKNQRQWKAKELQKEEIALFKKTMALQGFADSQVLVHASYLINLANPDPIKRDKSLKAFIDELGRVEALGLKFLNFHPGSHLHLLETKEALKLVAQGIDEALNQTKRVIAVIENTAGQKNTLGANFAELASLYDLCSNKDRIGFCLDTCHAHASGYDMAGIEAFEKAIEKFDSLLGRASLKGMHLNDAKSTLGSHLDRHANLGMGTIGWATFEHIARDERFCDIPLVLETPDSSLWKGEIAQLRQAKKL
ncbi:MAG: deoxyribonuclease IV [Spirochaetia bacterium]|nr:deoxyribonuclease IV [Spirochaetia bacterium]